ncbi:unnamed protein product [Gordionus sp. m RMFG-2023]|uniref:U2 snRNP-associated SURP motif-containing protein-like n=1 Tax=Gordionus sp. m RMFG-2023 TaxID=3053472 RepID=UPI0030E4A6C3
MEGLTPDFTRNIAEDKLKAFQIGAMSMIKKPTSKKIQEENKKKQDEIATAEIYQEFVSSFQEKDRLGKTFVRGEIVNAQPDQITTIKSNKTGQLYKPVSKLQETSSKKKEKPILVKKKDDKKKKSNLELFKEELQKIQEERQERNKLKQELRESINKGGKIDPAIESWLSTDKDEDHLSPSLGGMPSHLSSAPGMSDQWDSDPNTTNIFLANLNPKVNEEKLCELFGEFGPLASVKIMWPRTEEEIARNKNCGFVAYMNRKDGEKALEKLRGIDLQGYEMKLGWGKPVPIPPHPIYIPPHMLELTLPPPPSGLPFNAQPVKKTRKDQNDDEKEDRIETNAIEDDGEGFNLTPGGIMPPLDVHGRKKFEKTLHSATVRVVIPTERPLLCLIHRMIEFVIREGPRFEAMIMNRELKNPMFRFLFDNKSPAHIYYRWKLFSILNGDTPTEWRTKKFRLFKGGSYWQPPPPFNTFSAASNPPINPTIQISSSSLSTGKTNQQLPESLLPESELRHSNTERYPRREPEPRELLSQRQRDRLENMLRKLTTDREKVCEAMLFCVDHSEAAQEIVECLHQSLTIPQTPLLKKLSRIYLISDILYNCSSKAPNVSYFRKSFQRQLPAIFRDIQKCYKDIKARLKAEQFKQKIMSCLKAWEDWDIYPGDYICQLQNIFLGLQTDINVRTNILYKRYQEPLLSLINNGQNSFAQKQESLSFQLNQDTEGFDLDGAPLDIAGNESELLADKRSRSDIAPTKLSIYEDLYSDNDENSKLEDIDGLPFTNLKNPVLDNSSTLQNASINTTANIVGAFVKSKWEEVDETTLQAQVMTTSKWETLEDPEKYYTEIQNTPPSEHDDETDAPINNGLFSQRLHAGEEEEDIDGEAMVEPALASTLNMEHISQDKRSKLREIELKVIQYQDDLESGKISKKFGLSQQEQVQKYRIKLLNSPNYSDIRSTNNTPHKSSSSNTHSEQHKKSRQGSREAPKDSSNKHSSTGSRKKSKDEGSSSNKKRRSVSTNSSSSKRVRRKSNDDGKNKKNKEHKKDDRKDKNSESSKKHGSYHSSKK